MVYDAECWLCVAIKSKLEQMEVGQAINIRFVVHQIEEGMKVLGHDYRLGHSDAALLIRPSGEVLRGLEAFLPVFSNFREGKIVLWALRLPFARQLAERSYRTIARHRYRWFGEVKPVK